MEAVHVTADQGSWESPSKAPNGMLSPTSSSPPHTTPKASKASLTKWTNKNHATNWETNTGLGWEAFFRFNPKEGSINNVLAEGTHKWPDRTSGQEANVFLCCVGIPCPKVLIIPGRHLLRRLPTRYLLEKQKQTESVQIYNFLKIIMAFLFVLKWKVLCVCVCSHVLTGTHVLTCTHMLNRWGWSCYTPSNGI